MSYLSVGVEGAHADTLWAQVLLPMYHKSIGVSVCMCFCVHVRVCTIWHMAKSESFSRDFNEIFMKENSKFKCALCVNYNL